ncbi:NADPH:quinone reductase [Amnibacterium endophyticum]|uniref:NADPH:quinone reductase n=1 Tax=Amnibacterium endophyticum TaxID=2109337 RepID=A0ABW4LJ33_9MICO
MRAIVHDTTGDSSVLRLEERPEPQPGPGEVRVRVAVSGVNPTDWKRRSGGSGPVQPGTTPNQDGAGVVDAVGPGVVAPVVGERVWILLAQHERSTGTAQEAVVLPVERVVPLPEGASFDLGASLGVPALTAHRALTVDEGGPARLAPGVLEGRTVLVTGGAGAVGHAAIQLAAWAGARVITTISSPEKAALATAAGAHHAVDYTGDDPAAEIRRLVPDGVDTVVDVDLIRNAGLVQQVLAGSGTVAVYANSGTDLVLPMRPFMALNARVQFVLLYGVDPATIAAATADVTDAVRDGALPVGERAGLPLHRFPLERTADAHDAVEAGAVGKVLIDVAPDAG